MNVIDVVKNAIIERGGANGIRTMGVLLRQLDDNGNGSLSPIELQEGLASWDIVLSDQEVKKIMQYFDRDGNGSVTVDEFMRGLWVFDRCFPWPLSRLSNAALTPDLLTQL